MKKYPNNKEAITTNSLWQTHIKRLTKNATVFPVPVLALARTSLPKNVNWNKFPNNK